MKKRRFFLSFNDEDSWCDKRIIKIPFLIILLFCILVFIKVIPLKIIFDTDGLPGELLTAAFVFAILFGIMFFYTLFLAYVPNIFGKIPKYILIIASAILIPCTFIVFRDINRTLGFLIVIIINYIIGYDKLFNKNNLLENLIVSSIRFISLIIGCLFASYIIMKGI
ncbi:MAG: hypothetical protein FWD47_04065 [Treponema sp.]|nr:hypothetical protein [Treponema sp.]